jgi:Cu(I)/Ag(I) efflux system membrane protein CusA/SilA
LHKHRELAADKGGVLSVEEVRASVIKGALLRIRPIIMTVTAIIVGLLPIMLGSGTGSEVMQRIAAPMVGGMVSATLLTLIVIPAIFLLWKSRGLINKPGDYRCAEQGAD